MANQGDGRSDGAILAPADEAALWDQLRGGEGGAIHALRDHYQPLIDTVTNHVLAGVPEPHPIVLGIAQTIAFGIAAIAWSKKREDDFCDVATFEAFLTPRLEAKLRSSVLGDRSSDTWSVQADFAAIGIDADGTA
jgi:hypothetical protein